MPRATNVLLYDDSSQSATLGDACLIGVLSSISMMLRLVDIMVKKQSKRKRRNKIYQRIQRNRRTIQSLYDEYGNLFTRAYRMDYETFKVLHDLLKPGMDEYINNNNNRTDYTPTGDTPTFYRPNGEIKSEIRLGAALRFFAGGSYLDITISHAIGKTDVYCSVWCVVHAANQCPLLQFKFPTTLTECKEVAEEFTFRSQAGFNNCVGCIDGMLVWTEKPLSTQCDKVRINIECAFGILTNRWRILKSPLNANIPINRVNALVSCLCKIHNFCIDNGNAKPPERYPHDVLTLMDFINDTGNEDARPLGLLGGGEHFDDIPQGRRGANQRSQRLANQQSQRFANQRQPTEDTIIPRNDMLQHVITQDVHRPQPFAME